MNNVLSLVRAARNAPDSHPRLYSEHMLAELLSLHGEMIEQLRFERLGSAGNGAFLTSLIYQHEKTSAMLRAKIENHEVETNSDALLRSPPRTAPVPRHYRCMYFAAASLATHQAGTT